MEDLQTISMLRNFLLPVSKSYFVKQILILISLTLSLIA